MGSSDGPKKHRRPWTEEDDSRLQFDWGVRNADTIADRLGRSINAVVWRAKRLSLGPSYRGTVTVAGLAEETGFHRDRVVNAARKIGVRITRSTNQTAKRRSAKGRRTALNEDAAERIREFLRTYPDGAQIIQHPACEWGVVGRPACCDDCNTKEKRHYAKGLCEACYKRARYYARVCSRDIVSSGSREGVSMTTSYADLLDKAISHEPDGLEEVRQGSSDVLKALKAGGWVHVNVAGHTYEMAKNKMGSTVTVRKQKGGMFGKSTQYQSIEDALAAVDLGDQANSHIIQSGSF